MHYWHVCNLSKKSADNKINKILSPANISDFTVYVNSLKPIFLILSTRYVCTGGATSYIPTIPTHGYMCPTGHYCVEGTTQEQGCPLGTYQSNMGQDHCLSCPAGKMCTEVNLTLPLDCMTGRSQTGVSVCLLYVHELYDKLFHVFMK